MTFVVYAAQPPFPATDQNPNCVRYQVGSLWVDTDNASPPTQADIDALYAPGIAEATRIATVKANNRRKALVTAITNTDDAGIIAYINNNVTDLASAKVMLANLALLVAAVIRA